VPTFGRSVPLCGALHPYERLKRLRRSGGWGGIACASLRLSRFARLELHSHPCGGFKFACGEMADGEGFEPSVHCCTHAFQACAFDHSATHPEKNALINTGRRRAASRGEISFLGRPRRPASAREGDGLPGSGAMGIRTPDLLNAIEALYQLSYDP